MTVNKNERIVRGYLNNLSLSYRNEDVAYVSDKIFPLIRGVNRKTQVFKYVKADQFRSEAKRRAPGGTTPLREVRGSKVDITPTNWAVGSQVPDEDREDASAPGNFNYDPTEDAVIDIADQLWMKREEEMSTVLYAENWAGSGVGGADAGGNWGNSTETSDTMIADIKAGEKEILSKTGQKPNSLFLDYSAWNKICQSPFWISKLVNTQFAQILSPELVAQTLKYNIVIGSAIKNIEDESTDKDSFTSEWIMSPPGASNDKGHAFLYYAPATPGRKKLSVGYQYSLIKDKSGSEILLTERRDGATRSDIYEGEREFDFAPMCTDCGYLWKNTATA